MWIYSLFHLLICHTCENHSSFWCWKDLSVEDKGTQVTGVVLQLVNLLLSWCKWSPSGHVSRSRWNWGVIIFDKNQVNWSCILPNFSAVSRSCLALEFRQLPFQYLTMLLLCSFHIAYITMNFTVLSKSSSEKAKGCNNEQNANCTS